MLTINELCIYDWILRLNYCAETVMGSYKTYLNSNKYGETNSDNYLREFKKKAGDLLTIKNVELNLTVNNDGGILVYLTVKSPVNDMRTTHVDLYNTSQHPFKCISDLKEAYLKNTTMAEYIYLLVSKAYEVEIKDINIELKEATAVVNKCNKNLEIMDKYCKKLSADFNIDVLDK